MFWTIYFISVVIHTQEYFTYSTVASFMVGGNQTWRRPMTIRTLAAGEEA